MPASRGERRGGLASSTAEPAETVAGVRGAGRRFAAWTAGGHELVAHVSGAAFRAEPDTVAVDVPVPSHVAHHPSGGRPSLVIDGGGLPPRQRG